MLASLSQWGEFSLLQWLEQKFSRKGPLPHWVHQGIGDDAAVLEVGGSEYLLVTTDSLIENVHFDFRFTEWRDLGWKALAVNLSDIAAMGGCPTAVFLTLCLPSKTAKRSVEDFFHGFEKLGDAFHVSLLGGDCVASREVMVSVTLLGKVKPAHLKRRKGARRGDLVCATGTFGGAACGLSLLQKGKTIPRHLVQAQNCPRPPVREGMFLGGEIGVTAMMDSSDGLSRTAYEIAKRSGVGIRLRAAAFPVARGLKRCAISPQEADHWILHGGEEYNLVFTVKPRYLAALQARYQREFGPPFSVIGDVTSSKGVTWVDWQGKEKKLVPTGYDAYRNNPSH